MQKTILVLGCALILTLGACEKKNTNKPAETKQEETSVVFAEKVPQKIVVLAQESLAELGKDGIIVEAVTAQNAAGKTKAEIETLDKQWQADRKEGRTEPYMTTLMKNSCAEQLRKIMAEHSFITEIFVTDNQGANVCQTALTGDYWQGDEAKFKEVFKKGILIADPEMEDGKKISQVSIPVLMKKRHVGTMTIGVDIDKVPEEKRIETLKPEETEKAESHPATTGDEVASAKLTTDEATTDSQPLPPGEVDVQAEKAQEKEQAAEDKNIQDDGVTPDQKSTPTDEQLIAETVPKVQQETAEAAEKVAEAAEETKKVAKEIEILPLQIKKIQQETAKATQQLSEADKEAEKATREIDSLPLQVKKIQQDAEDVQQEVAKVTAQVKAVSEKVERVSMDSQQVLDKAQKAMDQVLKARAQLRDAAEQIQKAAASMNERLDEMGLMTGKNKP